MKRKLPEILVKPARKGLVVRKPNCAQLAAEGETVPENSYWLRRIRGGDVVKITPPKKSAPKKGKAK